MKRAKLKLSEHVAGAQPLRRPLPILAIGIRQGRLWVLHLESWSEENLAIPMTSPSMGEQVGVALSVLRWAVLQVLAQATIALRTIWRRIGMPFQNHRL